MQLQLAVMNSQIPIHVDKDLAETEVLFAVDGTTIIQKYSWSLYKVVIAKELASGVSTLKYKWEAVVNHKELSGASEIIKKIDCEQSRQ